MPVDAAIEYLQIGWPDPDTWRYALRDDAIVWASGDTISFRRELATVLAKLQSEGLPPLELVLLLLVATRQQPWGVSPAVSKSLRAAVENIAIPQKGLQGCFAETLDRLDQLQRVPTDGLNVTGAKCELAAIVFEEFPRRLSPDVSADVVQLLNSSVFPEELEWGDTRILPVDRLEAFNAGLKRVDPHTFRQRVRTGIDLEVSPQAVSSELESLFDSEPESTPVFEPRLFLNQLEAEPSLAGLARLTRHLMAMMHLPQSISEHDELPLGGVSDITNRGPLDRLLLSELAHDDDVLLTRLALNEALYLRREKPPAAPQRRRKILLDAGLRMWGLPRLYATGIGLSLALQHMRQAGTPAAADLQISRMDGEQLVDVDLTTAVGIQSHLETLDADLHPGAILTDWAQLAPIASQESEHVLVTATETLHDDEFLASLIDSQLRECFVISVDRIGKLELQQWQPRTGFKPLKRVLVDLDRFFAESESQNMKKPSELLIDPSKSTDLPAICRLSRFPLRIPAQIDKKNCFLADNGDVFSVSTDGRLLQWDKPGFGPIELSHQLPEQVRLLQSDDSKDNRVDLVVVDVHRQRHLLVRAELDTRQVTVVLIKRPDHYDQLFFVDNELVYAEDTDSDLKLTAIDLETGRQVATTTLNNSRLDSTHVGDFGYVFTRTAPERNDDANSIRNNKHYSVSLRNQQFHLELLFETQAGPSLHDLFYSQSLGCPLLLSCEKGAYRRLDGAEENDVQLPQIKPPTSFIARSRSGDQFILEELSPLENKNRQLLFDVNDLQRPHRLADGGDYFGQLRDQKIVERTSRRNLRTRVVSLGRWAGRLLIGMNRKRFLSLETSSAGDRIVLQKVRLSRNEITELESAHDFRKLQPSPNEQAAGLRLSQARWSSGAIAWFDKRGLLHLKLANPDVAQFSLILCDEHVSGWTADGDYFGNEYFIDLHESLPTERVMQSFIKPFVLDLG